MIFTVNRDTVIRVRATKWHRYYIIHRNCQNHKNKPDQFNFRILSDPVRNHTFGPLARDRKAAGGYELGVRREDHEERGRHRVVQKIEDRVAIVLRHQQSPPFFRLQLQRLLHNGAKILQPIVTRRLDRSHIRCVSKFTIVSRTRALFFQHSIPAFPSFFGFIPLSCI